MALVGCSLLVTVVGCSSIESTGGHDAAVVRDAPRPDAAIDEERIPFTTTGMTPLGSLDDVRYITMFYTAGFCGSAYHIALYNSNLLWDEVVVQFNVPIAQDATEPPTGTIWTTAWPARAYELRTEMVSFEVAHIDIPATLPKRIAGRMFISAGPWHIDFTIDAFVDSTTCF